MLGLFLCAVAFYMHSDFSVHSFIAVYLSLYGRLSYNKLTADCAGAVFFAMMKYALDTPHNSAGGFFFNPFLSIAA